MFEEIGSYQAKTKLPEILRRVSAGEAFTITNRGIPIADIIPSRSSDRSKAVTAIENILSARKGKASSNGLHQLSQRKK